MKEEDSAYSVKRSTRGESAALHLLFPPVPLSDHLLTSRRRQVEFATTFISHRGGFAVGEERHLRHQISLCLLEEAQGRRGVRPEWRTLSC